MAIKIKIENKKVLLPLHHAQGGIRIADEHGNHVSSPTQTKKEAGYFIEWMITNDENKFLADSFLDQKTTEILIERMEDIKKFAEESEYSKRKTIKVQKTQVESFEGFEIFQYTENFSSFEKTLESGIKVRITFKLGDFGLEPHPHMYVLIPFNNASLVIKNREGEVGNGKILGSGCFAEWLPTAQDLQEIIITLSHASKNHKDDLVKIIQSES